MEQEWSWKHLCVDHATPWDQARSYPAEDGVTCSLAICNEPAEISVRQFKVTT